MKQLRLSFIVCGAVLLSGMFHAGWALVVNPTFQVFDVKPGQTRKAQYTLTNNETQPVTVTPRTKDWFVLPANKSFHSGQWLKFDRAPLKFKAGETKIFKYEVAAPSSAVGELVGMMSFEVTAATASMIRTVLSMAVYVGLDGAMKLEGTVRDLQIDMQGGNLNLGFELFNSGNVHFRPQGSMYIFSKTGEQVAMMSIKGNAPVKPGKSASFRQSVDASRITPGPYQCEVKLMDSDRSRSIVNYAQSFVLNRNKKVELK